MTTLQHTDDKWVINYDGKYITIGNVPKKKALEIVRRNFGVNEVQVIESENGEIRQSVAKAMGTQSSNKVTMDWEKIDPYKAIDYLPVNIHNRIIMQPVVDRYARDMVAGAWMKNAQPICFSSLGVLLDGQHRLLAIVKSETTQEILVVRGLDPKTFSSFDRHAVRPSHQVFQLEYNESSAHSKRAVSIASQIYYLAKSSRSGLSYDVICQLIGHYKNDIDWLLNMPGSTKRHVRRASIQASFVLAHHKFPTIVEQFVGDVIDGDSLSSNSHAFLLRDYLMGITGNKNKDAIIIEKCLRAIKGCVNGDTISRLLPSKGTRAPIKFFCDDDFSNFLPIGMITS